MIPVHPYMFSVWMPASLGGGEVREARVGDPAALKKKIILS
jgi:hypothetical protein